ncbi:hypothetical protein Enr13x_05320 [Stieleria neptunia]|uniref:Uncharacterized protein n=2 Tax=Stieleria neptunia TaxID=2527979 RepID=A0A518HIL5_9BACT|nr:hypothetical protein Enr13x_05320 [Stieleria neptunia]
MELDARKISFAKLTEKYPVVSEAAIKLESNKVNRLAPADFSTRWEPIYSPSIVLHVGADFVLLQSAESPGIRMAIPADRIAEIRWGVNHPTLTRGPSRTTR